MKLIFLCFLAASCAAGFLALLPSLSQSLPVVVTFIPFFPPTTVLTVPFPFGSVVRTIAVSPDGSTLYAANRWNNTVSVVDLSRNEVVDIVHVFPEPVAIAITPDGSKVYVACPDTQKIAVIDVRTNEVKAIDIEIEEDLRCCIGPTGITITPDGSKAYVTNTSLGNSDELGQTVSVIDTSMDVVVETIIVGLEPAGLTVTHNGSRAYVANTDDDFISVIDVSTSSGEAGKIPLSSKPVALAITPDDSKVYVTLSDHKVSVIKVSTNEVMETIEEGIGINPVVVVISPDGSRAYVTNVGSNSVSVIDTKTDKVIGGQSGQIGVGPLPVGIAITADNSKIYVANQGNALGQNNTLSVVDVTTLDVIAGGVTADVDTIELTATEFKSFMVLGITDFSVYVANLHVIDVIDIATDELVDTIPAGVSGPTRIAITPGGAKAYAVNSGRGTVSVIDTSDGRVDKTVEVGPLPVDIEITPQGDKVLVANSDLFDEVEGDTVSVIRTSDDEVIATIPVGSQPVDIEITPDGARAFVANYNGGSVSVINVPMNEVIATVDIIGLVPGEFLLPIDVEIIDPDGADGPRGLNAYIVTSDFIVEIDISTCETDCETAIINLQELPVGSAFNAVSVSKASDMSRAYVANLRDGSVSVIDLESGGVETIKGVGPGPAFIGILPNGSKAYVAVPGSEFLTFMETGETVSVIDVSKNEVVEGINLGSDSRPAGIAVTPDGDKVLVPNYFGNTLSIIDTSGDGVGNSDGDVRNVRVGTAPTDVAITSNGAKAYVTNSVGGTISVIDLLRGRVSGTIDVNLDPD